MKLKYKRGIRQVGPTCRIYALMNGVKYYNKNLLDTRIKQDEFALDFLNISQSIKSYTVGEQFNSVEFVKGINQISKKLNNCHLSVNIISKGTDILKLPFKKKTFYLVPFYKFDKKSGANAHWLCVIPQENGKGFIVIDSAQACLSPKLKSVEELKKENGKLNGEVFNWEKWINTQPSKKLKYTNICPNIFHKDLTKALDASFEKFMSIKKRVNEVPLSRATIICVEIS